MHDDNSDGSTRRPNNQSEETIIESRRTREAMARIAFRRSLEEFLEQELTSVIDISKAVTLTDLPLKGKFGTVRELLAESRPSLQILTLLKNATKQLSKRYADFELTPPLVVYVATICAARLKLDAKITEFDDDALVDRIDRLLDGGEYTPPVSDLLFDLRFKLTIETTD